MRDTGDPLMDETSRRGVTKRAPNRHLVPLPTPKGTAEPRRVQEGGPNPVRVLVVECDPVLGGKLVSELSRVDDRLLVVGWVAETDGAASLANVTVPDVFLVGRVAGVELDGVASGLREISSAPIVALVDPPDADVGVADGQPIAGFIARGSKPREIARSFFEIARLALASSGAGSA
jgi:hypothetical protein